MGGAGRRWVSGLCQDRVWPTGGQTLHQPRQTNVGQRSILLTLRNYLIILLSPSKNFKKPENLNMSFFFHTSIIIFKTVQIVNWSALYMYIYLYNFMNELFSTIFYLLLSLPVRLQEIIFNCFFGSQIWKNDLWYVHGRNRQTGPGEATEAWTSVRRERIRRIIHQGALLHKICFRNWKVRTSV